MKLKKVWENAKGEIWEEVGARKKGKMKTRACGKCGSQDTMLVCMECLRKEKDKVLKEETKFQKHLNKVPLAKQREDWR